MRDAPEPTAADPTLALLVQNLCAVPGPENAGLTGRPGFTAMGTALGSAGVRTTQAILTWTKASGTRETTAIVGGKIYGYDWVTDAWTEVVTASNLSSASITLSTTARVALVPFADGLVVSDGVNTPFWWSGAAGAGGLTKMTNAPVFYGPPTVYYSRLVGIKLVAGDRMTIVWSEPGAPNTGYEAGTFQNAWDNPGGYSAPLTAICGTNEALYVFRERVSLAITGAVTSDWATAGTRANLSEDVGTLSPWAVRAIRQGVLAVDADAQPWVFRFGEPQPLPLWADCRQTVRGTPRAVLGEVQAVVDDCTDAVVIGYPEVGQTQCTVWLAFSQRSLQFMGVWGWDAPADRAGEVVDANGVARWAHAGSADGVLYAHGDLENGPWDDDLAAGTQYIDHAVVSAPLGYDLDRELVVHQIEAALSGTGISSVSVGYETPRGQSVPQTVSVASAGLGGTWDVDDWDEVNWAGITRDQRVAVGTLGRGRWVRVRVTHSAADEPFGLTVFRVTASAVTGNPRVP
jgi:hypothetical protein